MRFRALSGHLCWLNEKEKPMTDFEKARDEALDLLSKNIKINPGDNAHVVAIEMSNWSYKFMCNKDHQFALHRVWVDKHEQLTKEAEILRFENCKLKELLNERS